MVWWRGRNGLDKGKEETRGQTVSVVKEGSVVEKEGCWGRRGGRQCILYNVHCVEAAGRQAGR